MPARRRPWRLPAPRGPVEVLGAGLAVLAAASALMRLLHAVFTRWWPLLLLALIAAGAWLLWRRGTAAARHQLSRRLLARLRISADDLDAMDDRAFELALRDLLVRDGWSARHVGRHGDQAADVIAEHPRFGRLVVQAKHTRTGAKVGSQVMYQVKGTAGPVHGAHTAVVVTNGGFTRDATTWGRRHDIGCVDRARLHAWADSGEPLHQLLGLTAPRLRGLPALRAALPRLRPRTHEGAPRVR
ncbi:MULTISPECIES: restriction endonuclease [Streptomyces]|uniref:restriction endonuclease n=1 Tax=Streptomyces TaxID=1883 RepID=UPI001F09E8D4|nr:restriction endonuclease [Streptomyces sp. S5]